jgi:hypothetical protein
MKSFAAAALTLLSAFAFPASLAGAQTPVPSGTQNRMDHMEKAPVPPSKSLNVTFEGRTTTLSMQDLLALPQTNVHVHNAHSKADETYSGPLLADILAKAGLTSTRETEPLILHSTVVATGTDRYFVLYSAAEVEPAFSNSKVIVAVMKEGLPDAQGGLIQLINTDGAKPARWVHGLANLNVVSMTPSPE